MYFAFLGYYTTWLVFPAAAGALLHFVDLRCGLHQLHLHIPIYASLSVAFNVVRARLRNQNGVHAFDSQICYTYCSLLQKKVTISTATLL